MKKNIIMIIITLMCSTSLLLVLYIFNTKDIYYVSDKVIDNNEITMQIKNGSTYTDIIKLSDLDSAKYYRISSETNCSLGNASFYYSNSTSKLKIKVTSSPLKCKIVFEEIKEDVNIISMTQTVNGVTSEISTIPTSGNWQINYLCKNIDGTISDAGVIWNGMQQELEVINITSKVYCTVDFFPAYTVSLAVKGAIIANDSQLITNLAPNPTFDNNILGYLFGDSAIHMSTGGINNTGYLKMTPTTPVSYARTEVHFNFDFYNYVYVSSYYKGTSGGTHEPYLYNIPSNQDLYWTLVSPSTNWKKLSRVAVNNKTVRDYQLLLYGSYEDTYVAGMETSWDNIQIVNLSQVFKSHDIPTKEWCDLNIPFFEGTANVISTNIKTTTTSVSWTLGNPGVTFTLDSKDYCTNGATLSISSSNITISNITGNTQCTVDFTN